MLRLLYWSSSMYVWAKILIVEGTYVKVFSYVRLWWPIQIRSLSLLSWQAFCAWFTKNSVFKVLQLSVFDQTDFSVICFCVCCRWNWLVWNNPRQHLNSLVCVVPHSRSSQHIVSINPALLAVKHAIKLFVLLCYLVHLKVILLAFIKNMDVISRQIKLLFFP
jgi:hypothetical protein